MNKYLIKNCHYLHEHSCFSKAQEILIFPSGQTYLIKVERIWLCKYQNGPHQRRQNYESSLCVKKKWRKKNLTRFITIRYSIHR